MWLTLSPDGDLGYQFRVILPAEAAAVVFQALRAARNDLEHPHDDHDHGEHGDGEQPDGDHGDAGGGDCRVSADIPPHSGEHLNLSLAIWIAFANARIQADRRAAAQTNSPDH
jgi:hypothetical protein